MVQVTWNDSSDNWGTAADWSTRTVPGTADDVTIAQGDPQVTTDVGTVDSVTNSSELDLLNGGSLSVTAAFGNMGTLTVDDSGNGGSLLTIGGTLTNSGTLNIGNASLSALSEVSAASLANSGTIDLAGSSSAKALLDVDGAAGFGTAGTLTGTVTLGYNGTSNSAIEFASGQITTIASGAVLTLDGSTSFIEDVGATGSNSALTGLSENDGSLDLESGESVSTTGDLTNTGTIAVDQGNGGSSLTIGGTLTNSGQLSIGNSGLRAASEVSAQGLANSGIIYLEGGNSAQALLDVQGAAPGTLDGLVTLFGNSAIEFASGQMTTIASGAYLALYGSTSFIEDAGATGQNSALTSLSENDGTFSITNAVSVSTTGDLTNTNYLEVDANGTGGSTLTVGGTLTNSGYLYIGYGSGGLSAPTEVSTARLANTGVIYLEGGSSAQALLDVQGAAGFGTSGTLTGTIDSYGDSAIEFASGQITTIASDGQLYLGGPNSFIADAGATGSNSTLTGLSENDGSLDLESGESVSTTGDLTNTGTISVNVISSGGGSSLAIGGTLTNSGTLNIGYNQTALSEVSAQGLANSGTIDLAGQSSQALLDVSGAAGFGTAGTLTGQVFVGYYSANENVTGNSAIEFASGQITIIAGGALLFLGGATSFIEDAGATGLNSALTGLSENDGTLDLESGVTVSTTGGLTNTGTIDIDVIPGAGSSLTIGGALTNSGSIAITGGISPSEVSVQGLANSGTIEVSSGFGAAAALLNVSSAAGFGTAGTLTGQVTLYGGGAIEFASGEITTIASGASLTLDSTAYIEDAGATGSNSTLTGLTENDGALNLESGASVTTGDLTNTGTLSVDSSSELTIGSASGTADTVTVASTLTDSHGGSISAGATSTSRRRAR